MFFKFSIFGADPQNGQFFITYEVILKNIEHRET